VLGALALIKNRIGTALGRDIPFNEVLSAAYMEKQKMAVNAPFTFFLARLMAYHHNYGSSTAIRSVV